MKQFQRCFSFFTDSTIKKTALYLAVWYTTTANAQLNLNLKIFGFLHIVRLLDATIQCHLNSSVLRSKLAGVLNLHLKLHPFYFFEQEKGATSVEGFCGDWTIFDVHMIAQMNNLLSFYVEIENGNKCEPNNTHDMIGTVFVRVSTNQEQICNISWLRSKYVYKKQINMKRRPAVNIFFRMMVPRYTTERFLDLNSSWQKVDQRKNGSFLVFLHFSRKKSKQHHHP